MKRSRFTAALLAIMLIAAHAAIGQRAIAAENFRPFKMKTLQGQERTLPDVLGTRATLVAFFFPTCPYCNAAFPEMQKLYDAYKDRGFSMVWINVVRDEEKLIQPWLQQHGYTVPVLLGGRNVQNEYRLTTTPTHYLLDAKGMVISRHAGYKAGDEKALEKEIQQALAGATAANTSRPVSRTTAHLAFTATRSNEGLVVDITPAPGIHVYAPGSKYRAVKVAVQPQAGLATGAIVYPEARVYHFKPLKEDVLVYSSPFRLVVPLTDSGRRTALKAVLEYQACDDSLCYLPTSVPFEVAL